MLSTAGAAGDVAVFRARCPFPETLLSDQADRAIRGAVPDGDRLVECLDRLSAADTVDAELAALRAIGPLTAAVAVLAALASEWSAWWRSQLPAAIPTEQDCWDEHRYEHAFVLRSSGLPAVELRAAEYTGGRLDWSAVDAFQVDAAPAAPALRIERRGVPAPARFGGMPAPRLWEMEDARFDPGSIDAAPIDLGRLMLVGYATVYGNDWFVVPMRVPISTLSQVRSFVVHDVFGASTALTAIDPDEDGWNLFSLTAADQPVVPDQERPTSPWFFLAPTLPGSLESAPTDVVSLLRDEMANVAWAVEAVVADDQGRPRDRFAEWAARDQPSPLEPADPADQVHPAHREDPAYQVDTVVPFHWFPLVPEQLADQESVRLRLVPLSRIVDGVVSNVEPAGTMLPTGDAYLYEEEVPRSGVQVVRTWQHARWHDGSRHLWRARRKFTGSGEGSSGLRFDQVGPA